jgi:hypothetical protein
MKREETGVTENRLMQQKLTRNTQVDQTGLKEGNTKIAKPV